MATEYVECEIWVQVDAEGEWSTATDPSDLDAVSGPSRTVKVTVKVPKPKAVELVAVVADEPTTGEVKVA